MPKLLFACEAGFASCRVSLINFEGYSVDRERRLLCWHGEPIALSHKTFELLLYLIDHRGQVSSKERLLNDLWSSRIVEESNLTQQIFLLRKALSRHGTRKIIETIGRQGYRFAAESGTHEVSAMFQERRSVATITVEEEIEDPSAASASSITRWTLVGAAAALLMVAASYGWHVWQTRTTGQPVGVVLADFDMTGGDSALGGALDSVIRIDLSESPFVTVLSPSKVKKILLAMRESGDATLTPALAREVCERNASQVVLQGSARKFGSRYLLSLRATSCLNGDLMAEDKREVDREDDLPAAVDALAASVRRKLGESRLSISRFDQPLSAMKTKSLAALKAYTAGRRLSDHGDYVAALPLLQKAVEFDPNFGDAYIDITAAYFNMADMDRASQSLSKAYQLREGMGENNRLYTTALYHQIVDEDLEAGLESYKTYAALSPTVSALGMLANAYDDLGQAPRGVEPASRAVALAPAQQSVYIILSDVQLHSGLVADAIHTGELAIANGCDGDRVRSQMLLAKYANHDAAGMQAQLAWAHAHPASEALEGDEIFIALSQGENHRARALLAEYIKGKRPTQLQALFDDNVSTIARMLADEGLVDDSVAVLKSLSQSASNENQLVAMAEDGLMRQAGDLLQRAMAAHPNGTLWRHVRAPQVEAALYLSVHEPERALVALEPAVGWDRVNFGTSYLRGMAFLELDQFQQAVDEFKKINASQWLDPTSNLYPLSYLQLARAFVKMQDVAAAKNDYLKFLDLWKTADPDAPLLIAAKNEFNRMH
jgi:DNA-binding winged helix-turn-helix (wHTH) protein/tetratricopeptide (TPR) repeat protein